MASIATKFGLGVARFSKTVVGNKDYVTGVRYMSSLPGLINAAAGTSNTTGTLYFQPFLCTYTHTFTAISFANGNSMNGKKVRMGVYDMSGTTRGPNALVTDAGEITISDTSTNTLREITGLTISLTADTLYGLAWTCDTSGADVIAPSTFGYKDAACEFGVELSSDQYRPVCLKMTHVYGALPSSASGLSANAFVGAVPILNLKG